MYCNIPLEKIYIMLRISYYYRWEIYLSSDFGNLTVTAEKRYIFSRPKNRLRCRNKSVMFLSEMKVLRQFFGKKSVKSAQCSSCHPVSGSHIVSLLLVTVFALGAVLMTAIVIMDQQQQEITSQSVLLHTLEAQAAE